MLHWFTPNGRIPNRSLKMGLMFQGLMALILWALMPLHMMPKPWEVVQSLPTLLDQGLVYHMWISLSTNLVGLAIASLTSILIAYATVLPTFRGTAIVVSGARYFGITGFTVLFTLMLGTGMYLRYGLLVFCIVPFFVTSLVTMVQSIPKEEWDLARVMGMGPWRSVWEILVLGRVHDAMEILRQNASIGWMALTMVEGMTRSEGGLGVMMLDQNKHFNLAAVLALQGIIFSIGVAIEFGIGMLRKFSCPYADLSNERIL